MTQVFTFALFLPAQHSKRGMAVATWLAGWVSVCLSWYCIKTTKPILKLFRPSDIHIVLVFSDSCADTQFQGEQLHWGIKYTGVVKICNFRHISPFISERVRDRPMVTMER